MNICVSKKYFNEENFINYLLNNPVGVARLIPDLSPANSPTTHSRMVRQEIDVLANQPICPIKQNSRYFWTMHATFKSFSIS